MSLLADVAAQALDPGYAHAAARRAERPDDDPPGGSRPGWLAVGALLATLLVVVAALQVRTHAPAAAKTHRDLVASVRQQSAAVTRLSRQVDALRAATARLRDQSLNATASGAALAATLRELEAAAGLTAVSGPGLRVTLDDTHVSNPANRLTDRDLQAVVNALWAAGAEAVAIDGQRLTAQSAIRQAGDAILADFQPINPPYVIDAIGAPVGLDTSFATSGASERMRSYAQLYGIRFAYRRADRLTVPAAVGETLHFATPVPSATPTPGSHR
jgi:uncharacterized protein YlxW (UPF0749 family)